MKRILPLVTYSFLAISLFSACAKKDNNNAPPLPPPGKTWAMGATIGGVTWETDSVTSYTNTDTFSGVTFLNISGATKGDSAFEIGIEYGTGPGNYDLSNNSGYNLAFIAGGAQYTCTSGTLYIGTNSNHVIAGIFNGTVIENEGNNIGTKVSVTNGHFRVAY